MLEQYAQTGFAMAVSAYLIIYTTEQLKKNTIILDRISKQLENITKQLEDIVR